MSDVFKPGTVAPNRNYPVDHCEGNGASEAPREIDMTQYGKDFEPCSHDDD